MVDLNKTINKYKIFIPICGFNEDFILLTIEEALKKASHPDRVSFGVGEHRTDNNFTNLSKYQNVLHATLQYPDVLGIGIARLNALSFYNQEDFVLQIDAHTLFNEGGDNILIQHGLDIVKKQLHQKIIITNYVPYGRLVRDHIEKSSDTEFKAKQGYDFPWRPTQISMEEGEAIKTSKNDKFGMFFGNNQNNGYDAACLIFQCEIKEGFKTEAEAKEGVGITGKKMWYSSDLPNIASIPLNEYQPGLNFYEHYLFSAHFVFTTGEFIYEVSPDPFIRFSGEEQTTALRAGTRGYQIFSILPVVIGHLDKSILRKPLDRTRYQSPTKHLQNHSFYKNELGIERSKKILQGEIMGFGGAKNQELGEAYQQQSGFSFMQFFSRQKTTKK